jgi:2-methylcitrate dehydratase PrpD
MHESISFRIAEFAVGDAPRAVSDHVLSAASLAVADTIAVAVAGVQEPVSAASRAWATAGTAGGSASVWGTSVKAPLGEVALTNGAASHALDFDDALPTMRGHPSAVLVPALLAVAETTRATGREVLEAYVVGVEVMGRLGLVVGNRHYDSGWHSTSTVGALGAAAAVARLLGIGEAATAMALGIAASQASGLRRNFGTMTKPLHAGLAARAGTLAAWLAKEGVTANPGFMGGAEGFLALYASENLDGEVARASLGAFGQPWQLEEPGLSVKLWPCCLANYRPIAGFQELLRTHELRAEEIEEVRVGFLPGAENALVHTRPRTGLEAKFSVEYVIAALAVDGALGVSSFADEAVARPEVQALLGKVRRFRMPAERTYSGSSNDGYTDVEVDARGETFQVRVDRVPGSSRWPITEEMLANKLSACLDPVLGAGKGEALLAEALALGGAPDVSALLRVVTQEPADRR